jgi:UDP-2,3-diacylglucosamine pyrophosphatase LpxH
MREHETRVEQTHSPTRASAAPAAPDPSASPSADGPNLLVVSDLHVGEDLTGGALAALRKIARVNQAFAVFLEYYAARRVDGRPWRLIIAGDLIDFVRAHIAAAIAGDRSPEGSSVAAVQALSRVMAHHTRVFDAIGAFVAAGNELVIIKGNHDVELHWDEVRAALVEHLGRAAPSEDARRALEGRVSFSDWFWYEPGFVYVEHGNQYDEFCSFEHVLSPRIPSASGEPVLEEPVSHLTLRRFARLILGTMDVHGIDQWGLADFARWLVGLGPRLLGELAYTYFAALGWLVRFEGKLADGLRATRDAHVARLREFADRARLKAEVVERLHALRRRPAGWLRGVEMLYLDHVLIAFAIVAVFATALLVPLDTLIGAIGQWSVALGLVAVGLGFLAFRNARRDVETHPKLARVARQIHDLLDVRFVVFGHTHVPVLEPVVAARRFYVNTGSWSGDARGGFTHLFIRRAERPLAELRRWCEDTAAPVAYEQGESSDDGA